MGHVVNEIITNWIFSIDQIYIPTFLDRDLYFTEDVSTIAFNIRCVFRSI